MSLFKENQFKKLELISDRDKPLFKQNRFDNPVKKNKTFPVDKKKERKRTVFLLFGSVVLGIIFWYLADSRERPSWEQQQINLVQLTPTPTISPTPVLPKTFIVTKKFQEMTDDLKGEYGLYVYNFTLKHTYGVLQDNVFQAASLMKLPVLITLYQQAEAEKINLDNKYSLLAIDRRGGAGPMQSKPVGTVYTYRKMAELMGQQSDNTAYAAMRRILGDDFIQKNITAMGMKKTVIKENETTPEDIGVLLRKLYAGSLLTREHRDELLGYLTKTFDETRIPAGIPMEIRSAHKVGSDVGVVSDGGIVYGQQPFVLVIMTQDVLESQAKEIFPKLVEAVWDFEKNN